MEKPRSKDLILKDIENLTQEPGYIYSLALALRRDLLLILDEAAEINWHEKLSFQEFSLLIGLLIKREIDLTNFPCQADAHRQMEKTYELFRELHFAFNLPSMERIVASAKKKQEEGITENFSDVFGEGASMAEAIMYGGSGAYDFQYLNFSKKRYSRDIQWLKDKRNFAPETVALLHAKLRQLHSARLAGSGTPSGFQDLCEICFDFFCFSKADLSDLTPATMNSILRNLSIEPGKVNKDFSQPGEYNALFSHPIIQLPNGQYFLPILFLLAQSAYESPFYWMMNDSQYKNAAMTNRGNATTDIAYELLVSVFGKDRVHKEIDIVKKKGEIITDIDLLVTFGNKALIFQLKSKKLTSLARLGHTKVLKSDFKEAIQEAYDQGLKSYNALLKKKNKLFTKDGKELELEAQLNDAYMFCITSDDYPALPHQLRTYLKKGLSDPFPIAISLFDLELFTHYLRDPYDFVYYARQRIELHDKFVAASEIALLGYHLKHKLYAPEATDEKKAPDLMLIDEDYAQLIDANFPSEVGYYPKSPAMQKLRAKWKNDIFQELLSSLKSNSDPHITDVILMLYDLAGDGADTLTKHMQDCKSKAQKEKKSHDFSMFGKDGSNGITFIAYYGDKMRLPQRLTGYCNLKKYQLKSNRWLGLGAVWNSPNLVDVVCFNDSPWDFDSQLDQLADQHLKGVPFDPKTGAKLGRNSPCFCGSQKKFKKCHGK